MHYALDLDYTPPAPDPAPARGRRSRASRRSTSWPRPISTASTSTCAGLTATSVVVNGKSMALRPGRERTRVSPRPKLKTGQTATVVVTYGGTTIQPTDIEGALYGWVTTRDGAMVVSEPDGSATWFPVSDHPTDKATYSFDITVPDGLVAVANGLLEGSSSADGLTTWSWDAPDPMAAYLATATVGDFTLQQYTAPRTARRSSTRSTRARLGAPVAALALTGDMLTFFSDRFGPYPFVSYGAIVDDDSVGVRPRDADPIVLLAHRERGHGRPRAGAPVDGQPCQPRPLGRHLAQRGMGDVRVVDLDREPRWPRRPARASTRSMNRSATSSTWNTVLADPGRSGCSAPPVYDRGAALLHALRVKVGDAAFWEHRADLGRALSAAGPRRPRTSSRCRRRCRGQDLGDFFQKWAYDPTKPTNW